MSRRLEICSHCLRLMKGHASLNDDWLCHPDEGMDCYRLVTIYKHPMPCAECTSSSPCPGCGDPFCVQLNHR